MKSLWHDYLLQQIDQTVERKEQPAGWLQFLIDQVPELREYQTQATLLEYRFRSELNNFIQNEGQFSKPISQQLPILQVPYFMEDAGKTPAFPGWRMRARHPRSKEVWRTAPKQKTAPFWWNNVNRIAGAAIIIVCIALLYFGIDFSQQNLATYSVLPENSLQGVAAIEKTGNAGILPTSSMKNSVRGIAAIGAVLSSDEITQVTTLAPIKVIDSEESLGFLFMEELADYLVSPIFQKEKEATEDSFWQEIVAANPVTSYVLSYYLMAGWVEN